MMLKEDTGNVACSHHHHDDDDDDAENDRRSNAVAVTTTTSTTMKTSSGGGGDKKVPKRVIEKEPSLGSVISAITLDTDFGNMSSGDSFSISTRSLSSSKKFEITLSPTLELLGEGGNCINSSQTVGGGGGSKSESRFDASPLKFENSFNRRPMCLPERQPSEGSLANNNKVNKKKKHHRNKMRGKKNDIFQHQQPRRCSSPPRLQLSSRLNNNNKTTTTNPIPTQPSVAVATTTTATTTTTTTSCCNAVSGGVVEPPLRCPERKPSGGAIEDAVKEKRRMKHNKKVSSLNDVINMNFSPKKPERKPSDTRLMTGGAVGRRNVTKQQRRQRHQHQHQHQRSLSPRAVA